MKRVMSIARQILILGAVLSFNAGLLFSCRDKIDESDMYSFTGMVGFLESRISGALPSAASAGL